MSARIAIVAGLVLAVLGAPRAAAQAPLRVGLASECPTALPPDLWSALELELELDAGAVQLVDDELPDLQVVIDGGACDGGDDVVFVVLQRDGAIALGPERLDLREFGARLRGRVLALWIAENVRAVIDAEAPTDAADSGVIAELPQGTSRGLWRAGAGEPIAVDGPGDPSAPGGLATAETPGEFFARGSLAFAFAHDLASSGIGPGADLRLELGARGRPRFAGEIGIGGAGLTMRADAGEYAWTELRASLGALVSVPWTDAFESALGLRVVLVHEVLVGVPNAIADGSVVAPPLRINDGLDTRAAAFARAHLHVTGGVSIFVEVEIAAHLFALVPSNLSSSAAQNVAQGIARLGLSLE